MALVLTPILKNSMHSTPNSAKTSHVKFNLPEEQGSVIEYLQGNAEASPIIKANLISKTILSPSTQDSLLLKWILEFKENIVVLDRENESITVALLHFKWYLKNEQMVLQYQELILNLVTAHPKWLTSVLSMIIKIFSAVSGDNEDITIEEKNMFNNAHGLLKRLIEIVPLSRYQLGNMLLEKFPYMKSPTHVMLCYVENLLNICSYLPTTRLTILLCIVEKIIHIDVNCFRDMMYEIQNDEDIPMELDESERPVIKPVVHTLDVIIDCLFKYIRNTCFIEDLETLNWEATKKLYKELLTVFDKVILPTHGSCHVQYLMFYVCSLKQELHEGFLDFLWKKVQNPNISSEFRQIASFYIGSLLARAKYINISTVTACFGLMCNWIHRYIDNHTSQDCTVHGTFHSVCQTVFYVFAFRIKELIELKTGYEFLRSLNFDRIVSCRLNPLRYCDRTIVQNFASIARNYQISYVYPIIEKNNRNLLYAWENNSGSVVGSMVRTFFPFDPYLLKKSKCWVEPHFRIYNSSHKDEEDHLDEEEVSTNEALFSYSTSPGFKKFLLKS
ncbi:RNA polymerase I-specific transcription initiation factor RRN3-like [Uloborus diversus]|uniref:RNA polymerase I-specific transcription initiation factor RRN3-like n=1 Tax=Uloborus diversus TaxID=327109 RepID=UPI00240A78C9|nr:RNA polymerase I-specific transcription initiation factor RRN3-like [Uloborus diversus]